MSDADTATSAWSREAATVARLAEQLYDCDVIVNCAGNPDASSQDLKSLFGANGALPGIVAAKAGAAGASRYVHVSSAVVQGAALQLDDSAGGQCPSPLRAIQDRRGGGSVGGTLSIRQSSIALHRCTALSAA